MDEEEDDEYVVFGTPLPEIEDEATLRKKAAKELQVHDEKGRQRFHGAFTGGFSAGYFNTVGTKEGWAPSSFISSRKKVADRIQQNPEDYMDDEDFSEFGIATRKIHTAPNFQDTSQRKAQKRNYFDTDAVIPGEAPLKDIVQPVRESIGIEILKKLGWREGQGIGPRIKKISAGTKVYGCSLFPDATDQEEEEDPIAAAFTFAPKDTESMSYKSKDNYFGIGYTGLSKQTVLNVPVDLFAPTSTKSWLPKEKKKLKISGQAFGVGALEDEDDDIYGKDDMSQYDFSDLELKGSEKLDKTSGNEKQGQSQGVIDGFHLAKEPPLVKKHYPPPTLPSYFNPIHSKYTDSGPPKQNPVQSRHALSASDRSLLIGEKKFQKAPSPSNAPSTSAGMKISNFHQKFTSSTTSNFCPFPNDLAKQQRYEEFLKLKETGDVTKLVQPSSMTEWEKQQEVEEFAKASVFFKPLSNALSSRFESRSHLSVEHEVMAALEKIKKEKEPKQAETKKSLVGTSNRKTYEWHPVSLLCKRMNVPNPYPNSVNPGSVQSNLSSKSVFDHIFPSEKFESSSKLDVLDHSSSNSQSVNSESKERKGEENQNEAQDIAAVVKDSKSSFPEEGKPSMDLFKDIFGDSSSDEDESKQEDIKAQNETSSCKESNDLENSEKIAKDTDSQNFTNKESELKNVPSNPDNQSVSIKTKKVGFGVFANLDLDALNQRQIPKKLSEQDVSKVRDDISVTTNKPNASGETVEKQPEVDMYGPKLPPNFSVKDNDISGTAVYSKNYSKKRAKSKSSRKHKHHKHKHKKKKKKSSKKDSSSSDSSEKELDDIPPSLIIEKMKKLQKKKF